MPPLTRFALGSLVVLVVLLTAGALPAFSSPASAGHAFTARNAARLRLLMTPAFVQEKAAAEQRYTRWRQRRGAAPATPAGYPRTAVSGNLNQPGITDAATAFGFGVTPSDSTGAIGPSNYVEFINSEIAVYDSSDLTAPTATVDETTFTGDSSPCDGQIQWDEQGQRWLYAILGNCFGTTSGHEPLYFGWSKTATPDFSDRSTWCQYTLDTGNAIEDYPKLGHDDSQIIIGTNEFDDTDLSYIDSSIWVFDKPADATTCPSSSTELGTDLQLTAAGFTPVGVNLADSSTTGYVVDIANDQEHLHLYAIGRNGGGDNVLLSTTSVTVPAFDAPAPVPQPGTSDTIDSSDSRLTQAVAATDPATGKEGIWTQHTIAGPGGGPSVVRWYELTPGAATPRQSGTVSGSNGSFAFNGAISPTKDGTSAAIFYNSGSSSQLVDVRVQDRRSDTPLATTIEDVELARSSDEDSDFSCPSQTEESFPCRWGDYAGASPDPSDSRLVWGTEMLTTTAPDAFGDGQWGTQNAAVDTSVVSPTLTVSRSGSGSGTVTSDLFGITCGSYCLDSYPVGTSITLTESPGIHSFFAGWSGACSGAVTTCTVTMDQARSVTAIFALIPETLSVTKAGSGSGTVSSSPAGISCGSACSQAFTFGTSVTLAATPAAGSVFSGWSGACSGTGSCTVGMTQAQAVTATFALLPETLTVTKSGSGTVTSSPVGISCGPTCSQAFAFGTSVTLSRTPASGWLFKGWSGACSGTGVCSVTMSGAQSVHATFAKKTACVVPKLKGKTLKAAKRALTRAHCRAGKITKKYSRVKSGRVISQKPRPGKHLRVGARVNLTVSKGKKP